MKFLLNENIKMGIWFTYKKRTYLAPNKAEVRPRWDNNMHMKTYA